MLSINDLSYYIGGRALYENTSLHINGRDKIGLVGLNGSGKTTLIRIIKGEATPEQGTVSKLKDCTIGVLEQEISHINESVSILEVAMLAFKPILDTKHKIESLLEEIEIDHDDKKISKLADLQSDFEIQGGYAIQSQAEEILEGIGFKTSDLNRPMGEFSGGWKMRVMLAKLLLEKPSLLMLDEPTNHLDLPSIQWFENYLKVYEGAIILVSHDKQFIDNTVNKIIHIEDRKLKLYNGNYSFFLSERESRMEIQQNAHLNQQKKIKEAERFINRFRAKSTKARQVQSKIKLMEKVDIIENVKDDTKTINFQFRFNKPSGKHVYEIREMNKSFSDLNIFRNTSADIHKGDKIALIGANGLGKTTLLKIIAGVESCTGKTGEGYNVIKAYYAQHQVEALSFKNNVLEELLQSGSDYSELELRSILGSFLFSGDDAYKKISSLSGGEKARVALAKTLISDANFLVLDEPTNHLDINSVDILISALESYKGSLIMVSHDRSFIDEVANKIWYIQNNQIKEYAGTMTEYIRWSNDVGKSIGSVKKIKPKIEVEKKESKLTYEEQKEHKKNLRSLKNKLIQVEDKIETLELKIKEAEHDLVKPEIYSNFEKLSKINKVVKESKKEIDDLHSKWENTYIAIESAEKK